MPNNLPGQHSPPTITKPLIKNADITAVHQLLETTNMQ